MYAKAPKRTNTLERIAPIRPKDLIKNKRKTICVTEVYILKEYNFFLKASAWSAEMGSVAVAAKREMANICE